jgi:hypothetical protein
MNLPAHLGQARNGITSISNAFVCVSKCSTIQAYLGVLRHSVKLRTNPRLHERDSVSRTNTIDTIEQLYSYLAGMNGVTYTMHNVLCRSVTIEERFTASSQSSGPQQYWSALYGSIWRELIQTWRIWLSDQNHSR